jgi:hypothetical protein
MAFDPNYIIKAYRPTRDPSFGLAAIFGRPSRLLAFSCIISLRL